MLVEHIDEEYENFKRYVENQLDGRDKVVLTLKFSLVPEWFTNEPDEESFDYLADKLHDAADMLISYSVRLMKERSDARRSTK